MSKASPRGAKWKKLRLEILARDSYLCGYCGGEATTVDHIQPVAHNPHLTYDPGNLVAACKPCNSAKTDKIVQRTTWINPKYLAAIRSQRTSANSQLTGIDPTNGL